MEYFWSNGPLLSDAEQKADEKEYEKDEEDVWGVTGRILLCSLVGVLTLCLVCRVCAQCYKMSPTMARKETFLFSYRKRAGFLSSIASLEDMAEIPVLRKSREKRLSSDQNANDSKAGRSQEKKQERRFPKGSQESASHWYSPDMESVDENPWVSVWKENEAEPVLPAAGCRQRAAPEQRDTGIYWIREQPCPHCKAERTRQWLSQHFFKPTSSPPASDAWLEEDFYQAINP